MTRYRLFPKRCFLVVSLVGVLSTTGPAQETSVGDSDTENGVHWSIDPDYEAVKSRVSYVPGIKIIRGKTQVIVPERKCHCPAGSVFKFNNGDIQVYNRRSSDGGQNWHEVEHILENSTYQFPEPDGEVIMFQSSFTSEHSTGEGRPEVSWSRTSQEGVFEAKFFRSKDHGLSRIDVPAKIHLPEQFNGWRGVLCRKIVRLNDGSLLMSMYARDEKGTALTRKFRSMVLRSTDRGRNWSYLSTIAFDATWDLRNEGFGETSLLVLDDGTVLSFIRSGASYQASIGSDNHNDYSNRMPFSYGKQTPVYLSTSIDGGMNWSNADPITEYGVWPNAVLMDNGLLAVSYGRPGNWIMFSKDKGQSWGPVVPFYHDLYPPDCSNYVSMVEVAPDVLLVVYARTNLNDHWRSEIVGTYFHVKHEQPVTPVSAVN